MAAIVPLLYYGFIFLIIRKIFNTQMDSRCWRDAFLATSVIWAVTLTAITEVLSIFRVFSFTGLLVAWLLVSLVSAGIFGIVKRKYNGNNPSKMQEHFDSLSSASRRSVFLYVLVGIVILIVILIGLVALIAPPNNEDALCYHIARVAHWAQNRSVAHYPTHILRQLHMAPLAEFIVSHFYILTDGDRLANLVQWFSMVASLVGISLIAQLLGGKGRAQVIAVVVGATIPMGILQASSAQNDYVVSLWLVCLAYYTLRVVTQNKFAWRDTLGIGCSLGLAILTKSTAYIFAFPFMIWLFIWVMRNLRRGVYKAYVAHLGIILTIFIVINLGHYLRNYQLFGAPATSGEFSYTNEDLNVSLVISNVLRNIALHTGTPSQTANAIMEKAVVYLHKLLRCNVSDPRTTWHGYLFSINKIILREDFDPNPVHLLLILVSIGISFTAWRNKHHWVPVKFAITVTTSFLLFCIVLKWQPWHSRLHLPLFVLWSPFIAVMLETKSRKLINLILCALLVISMPWVMMKEMKPLIAKKNIFNVSRLNLYFAPINYMKTSLFETVRLLRLKNIKTVGVIMSNSDQNEYPLWAVLRADGNQMPRIEHVNVRNVSSVLSKNPPFDSINPEAKVLIMAPALQEGAPPNVEIWLRTSED